MSSRSGSPRDSIFVPEAMEEIFVNRSVDMASIKFYGFDMDYTLAEYKSPQYEKLGFSLVQNRLVSLGYPDTILEFEYDPKFPIRGLWFDKLYGNLLKVDAYGNILLCMHGFTLLEDSELEELYPNKFIKMNESIFVMNTLFNLPETYLLACLIDFIESSPPYVKEKTGIKKGEQMMSFESIFRDVRSSVDWVHARGNLKTITIGNLDMFVKKKEKLPILIDSIRKNGAKVFLLTNSDYYYTDKIMSYLFDFPSCKYPERNWQSYFDTIVVDAKKPLFFGEGTLLKQVDTNTGALKEESFVGPLQTGSVYSGGSCDILTELIGAKGKDVLYVGDHIHGDILKSKKTRGWRTFLIVPEVVQELKAFKIESQIATNLRNSEILKKIIDDNTNELSGKSISIRSTFLETNKIRKWGSTFRSGNRQTFFSSQLVRYADLYSSSFLNLTHYPPLFSFKSAPILMPHEHRENIIEVFV